MIKKLRFRFIFVAMISVVLVLSTLMLVINILDFNKVYENADNILTMIINNGGVMPNENNNGNQDNVPSNFSRELPYKTRYFTVKITQDGEYEVNLSNVIAINENRAIEMANKAFSSGNINGKNDIYCYKISNANMVVFVDMETELKNADSFLKISIIVSLIGLLGVFFLVLMLSKSVLSPVEDSYKKQKEFITNATHELKTPLTIISLNNELTEITFGNNESIEAINKQVERMNTMVRNMVSLAKLDEGNVQPNFSKISLTELVNENILQYKNVYESGNKNFNYDIVNEIYINADKNLIKQLFSIVFENANKYANSNINVNLVKKDKKTIFTISNDADVENGNLEKYFERFFRSSTVRGLNIEGSGIGLSVAKEIVNLHKGKITAQGENGKFILSITFNLI